MEALYFNAKDGFLEAILRGFLSELLTTSDYNNLCQCETLDDLKLQLSGTCYGKFLQDESSNLHPTTLVERCVDQFLDEFNYLRCNAEAPLSTFLEYCTYGHMIDNVVLMVMGTLHDRDVQELLEKCHPLGMFDGIASVAVAQTVQEIYKIVLIDTPLAKYFSENLSSEDLDEMNVEILRNTLYKAYLKDFATFCKSFNMCTSRIMQGLLNFEADRRTISIAINSLHTDLTVDDKVKLFTDFGQLYPSAGKFLATAQDVEHIAAVLEGYPAYADIVSKKLKIETFDNTTYESRNQEEWCPQTTSTGKTEATAVKVGEDGSITWVPCHVMGTKKDDNTYLVRYTETSEEVWLPRMYICFKAEDPFIFSKRVAESFKERKTSELQLRYNFFIDNMPTEDIPPLTNEQVNRVLVYALNSKKLMDKLMDTSQLINEVNIDFARTMNKLIFDKIINQDKTSRDSSILSIEDKFPVDPKPDVPESGTFPIPLYDFPEQFSEFSFHTFLTKPEVISAIVKVKSEGLKIQKMNIFNIHYTKSSKSLEFEQAQGQATDQVSNQVKETWILTLKNLIRSSFKDVGKGWFNLNEQNQETYEFSKLKKFLRVVRFMMEDTLRILIESSYEKFVNFIEAECNCAVDIVSPAVVVVQKSSEKKRKVPLFSIELAMDTEKSCFHYSTPLDKFLAAILKVFEQGITSLQGIPSIEPSIMENLFWGSIPILNVVHPVEAKVVKARDALENTVKFFLVALNDYLKQYEKYNHLLELDVNQFCSELSNREDISLDLLKKTIAESEEYLAHLKSSIPLSIVVGSYMVNTGKVREFLISKQSDLIAKVKDVVVEIPKKRVREICQKYEEIDRKLKVKTQKPEDVDDMRRLMENIPTKNAELREEILSLNDYYNCLYDMRYTLSESDSQSAFVGSFWGVKIERLMESTTQVLEKDQERYEDEMDEEQDSFNATIETLTDTVNKFSQYTDLSKVDYVYDDVQQITQQLKKAQDDANLFNRREGLFQKEITDYSHLQKVTSQFEPFQSLWKYAAAWKSWENEWMNGVFIKLDPDSVDKNVNISVKSLHKTAKSFTVKNLDKCAENCQTTKTKIEDFMKYIPIITALRNPGMRDRHWEQISEEIKQELNPDETFTLKTGLEMGIMDHEERIIKIADVAGKEFSIEQALNKMQNEWSTVELQLMEYRETGTYIVKVDEAVIQQLDDHIVMSQSMSFSPYKKPFEERITNWEQQLSLVSEVIDEWIQLQRQWMYLEPIFNSEDIQHQLPLESKRFSSVDRMWRKTLQQAYMTPHILTMCSSQKLLESYTEANKMLDSVQKGLADYLETKRLAFARFFFLSNDELLQILSKRRIRLLCNPI